ncbi:MAG: hypothetical protein IKP44_08200, partial [Bacteroidaceae bacterium]|nr:hypothetical protein [Bacteroidaceae bacterium]
KISHFWYTIPILQMQHATRNIQICTSPVFMVESPFGLFLLMWLTVDLLNKWFFSNLVEK